MTSDEVRAEHADWCPRVLHVDCCRVDMCECGAGAINAEIDRLRVENRQIEEAMSWHREGERAALQRAEVAEVKLREKANLLAEALAKLAEVRELCKGPAGHMSRPGAYSAIYVRDVLQALDGGR